MKSSFSKNDTKIVKGIAILAMVFHHIYPNNPGIPVLQQNGFNLQLLFATTGKVCVVLLTILSGYGITCSWKNNANEINIGLGRKIRRGLFFTIEHYIQLLSMYWAVLIFAYICEYVFNGTTIGAYGEGTEAKWHMFLDVFGLGSLSDGRIILGGWYLTAIVFFYFLFPIIYVAVKKLNFLAVILMYIPWIYYLVKKDYNMHTDWWLFYIFAFAMGVYLAEYSIIVKISQKLNNKKFLAVIILIVAIVIRGFIALPADILVACAIIIAELVIIGDDGGFGKILGFLGANSANIWLMHIYISFLVNDSMARNYAGMVLIRVIICLSISLFIENVKTAVGYNTVIAKIRNNIRKLV